MKTFWKKDVIMYIKIATVVGIAVLCIIVVKIGVEDKKELRNISSDNSKKIVQNVNTNENEKKTKTGEETKTDECVQESVDAPSDAIKRKKDSKTDKQNLRRFDGKDETNEFMSCDGENVDSPRDIINQESYQNGTHNNGENITEKKLVLDETKLTDADRYYTDNSEFIEEVISVNDSKDTLTEKQVSKLIKELGFTDYPITYEYDVDGKYLGENEVEETSNNKHPMYQTSYISDKGDIWTIFVINGTVMANPVSFNMESKLEAQLLVSENEKLTSYDDDSNRFYITIPKKTSVIVKKMKKIDAKSLNNMNKEELENYEKYNDL